MDSKTDKFITLYIILKYLQAIDNKICSWYIDITIIVLVHRRGAEDAKEVIFFELSWEAAIQKTKSPIANATYC